MRSLVVEDEFASREKLKFLLNKYGECIAIEDGEVALTLFNTAKSSDKPFSLVCLDINMPRMSGHTVLDKIRKAEDQEKVKTADRTKVFMITGLSDGENISKAFYELADDYITKPITKDTLETCLKKHQIIQ